MAEEDDFALLEAILADDSNTRVISGTATNPVVVESIADIDIHVVEPIKEPTKEEVVVEKLETTIEKRIRRTQELTEEYHPGAWDFQKCIDNDYLGRPNNSAVYTLTILFPKLTMTNSSNDSHVIQDLYVSMCFTASMHHQSNIYGVRGKLTGAEYFSSYVHSHLSPSGIDRDRGTSKITRYGAFCLGGGTELIRLANNLVLDEWNEELFASTLLHLHSYVDWESSEGGPYMSMHNISINRSSSRLNNAPATSNRKEAYMSLLRTMTYNMKLELDKSTTSAKFVLANVDELEIGLIPHTPYYQYKNELGVYSNIVTGNNIPELNTKIRAANSCQEPFMVFKSENIRCQVDEVIDPNSKTDAVSKVPHRDITTYVQQELEKEINNYYLKIKI